MPSKPYRTRTPSLPHSHTQRWLLAYDIADPKRLQKVWRHLRQEGIRLQHSVYLIRADRAQLEEVLIRLRTLIDAKADDVRVYPITENTRIWGLGTQFNNDGNTLCDELVDKLKADSQDARALHNEDEDLSFSQHNLYGEYPRKYLWGNRNFQLARENQAPILRGLRRASGRLCPGVKPRKPSPDTQGIKTNLNTF